MSASPAASVASVARVAPTASRRIRRPVASVAPVASRRTRRTRRIHRADAPTDPVVAPVSQPEPGEHLAGAARIGRAHEHPRLTVAAELLERALRDEATRAHHADVGTHLLDLGEQVARHEHRRAVVGERADERPHLARALRVEAVRRLVEHEELTSHEQRVREPEPLLHAERVGVHLLLRGVREADAIERVGDARRASAARGVPVCGVEPVQVRRTGEVRREGRPLDERADAGQHRVDVTGHVGAEHAGTARGRRDEAEEHPDRGRLARAVRPEESEHRALRHHEVEAVDGELGTETLREAVRLDRQVGHARLPVSYRSRRRPEVGRRSPRRRTRGRRR